jgi:predicted deacylase
MINSFMHGNEFYGNEVLYSLTNWLLTSKDPDATRILQNNYVLIVPVVDYRWGRTNYNSPSWMTINDPTGDGKCGVNLNRNFSPSWSSSLSTSQTDAYSGIAPDSEKETQALINAWNKYHPRVYWDLHQGATPSTMCSATSSRAVTDANKIRSLLPSIQSGSGVTGGWTFSVRGVGSGGYAKDGAAKLGSVGFLSEVMSGWSNAASKKTDLDSGNTFKQVKAMFIAMCRAIEGSTQSQTLSASTSAIATPTPSPTPSASSTPILIPTASQGSAVPMYTTVWAKIVESSWKINTFSGLPLCLVRISS